MIQLSTWFRRKSLESGLDRELQYHFDRRVADLTAAGIPEPDARRRVAVELGLAQVREEIRDVWLTRWFRDFLYDLRFSARSFLRSPGFTAATLLSLALGIGATTAIYSLVDQVILHALPVREPGRLVLVDWNGDDLITYANGSGNLMPYSICRDLQQQTRFLDRLRPDVTLAQAQPGLQPWFKAWLEESTRSPVFPRISADHRREYLATTLELTSAPQGHSPLRRSLAQPLWLLFAATGVLLSL